MKEQHNRQICTVMTYNVHSCIGGDKNYDPLRTAEVIRSVGPDIAGLQEVDNGYRRMESADQLAILERETGLKAVEGGALIRGEHFYGNALLTKWPVVSIKRHDLTYMDREPRSALDVRLKIYNRDLRCIVTHFGLRWKERRRQAERIVEIILDEKDITTVICGDFNYWLPFGPARFVLRRHLGRTKAVKTFPAPRPFISLDMIWLYEGGPRSLAVNAWKKFPAKTASDHLPIWASVGL